jgi:cyclophilin family peptidyl-prolyl cis-trans isomerase
VSRPVRPLALVLACLALALAGCGGEDRQSAPAATPEDTGGEQTTGCRPADAPAPRPVALPKPKVRLDPARTYVATVATNCGAFQIALDAKRAPRTGGSFKYLADKGFYDGLAFYRISPGFAIQGGDPAGDGTGGPGYTVVEPPPRRLRYTKGVVAMAKTDVEPAGTSGSQFFVVTAEETPLDPQYALVGRVTGGQAVVDRIGVAPVGADERPVEPIVIRSIEVAAR